jgi:hypothetical protein
MSKEEIKRLIMLGVEIATDNCVPTSPDEFGIINIDFDNAAIEDEVNNAVEYEYKKT